MELAHCGPSSWLARRDRRRATDSPPHSRQRLGSRHQTSRLRNRPPQRATAAPPPRAQQDPNTPTNGARAPPKRTAPRHTRSLSSPKIRPLGRQTTVFHVKHRQFGNPNQASEILHSRPWPSAQGLGPCLQSLAGTGVYRAPRRLAAAGVHWRATLASLGQVFALRPPRCARRRLVRWCTLGGESPGDCLPVAAGGQTQLACAPARICQHPWGQPQRRRPA
jgi:hypothetical protein